MKNVLRIAFRKLDRRVTEFSGGESGVMAVHIIVFFMLMILVGGIAVDMMRFETKRVALQNTMDRATLAAASLEQTLDPTEVVHDWFSKSGLSEELDSVEVDETMNSRSVHARATIKSPNYFMSIMDIPYLESQNRSQAEQRINNVEIILVLDISGSMKGAKIDALKTAAKAFVDTVKAKDDQNRVSIGIVPYNAQVNLGQPLRSKFNATYQHGVANVNCLELPTNTAFHDMNAIPRTTAIPMMANADVVSATDTNNSYTAWTSTSSTKGATPINSAAARWCNPTTTNIVTMPTTDPEKLKLAIDNLSAEGNTSIFLGMRWASALLAPETRPIYDEMIAASLMGEEMSGRPFEYTYNDRDAMKVVVLMTDGEHVAHNHVPDAYKSGNSDIWRATSDNNYSIFHDSKVDKTNATTIKNSKPFWVPHLSAWHARPWNGSNPAASVTYSATATYTGVNKLTWPQVWNNLRVTWVAWQLYGRPLGGSSNTSRTSYYNTWLGKFRVQYAAVGTMNSRLADNCAAAKAEQVIIYGIAFQAPENGQTVIRNCANTPASTYYYPVEDLDIASAFEMIASNLSQLRLTQ